MDWTVRHHGINRHEILFTAASGALSGEVVGTALCLSDIHLDAAGCDRAMLLGVLEQAKEKGCPILINGDVLDIMQSRNDPRRMSGEKVQKFEVPNYIDAVIEDAADFFEPYAHLIAFMGMGNHEAAQIKQLGTDCLERLSHELRRRVPESPVRKGGYSGWCKFKVGIRNTQHAVLLHYFHGSGGSAPVTQGTIQAQRNSQALPDANIVWTGHVHSEWSVTWSRWRLSPHMRIYRDEQLHFSTPGFVDGLNEGIGGWAVEKGNKPRPMGGAWLDLIYNSEIDPTGATRPNGAFKQLRGLRYEYRRAK